MSFIDAGVRFGLLRTLITRGDLLKPRRESVITSLPPRTMATLVGRAASL